MTVSAAKKSKSVKGVSSHPPYGDMIKSAVIALRERGGSSRQAIAKHIKAHYKVDDKVDSHLRRALVSGVKSGKLIQTRGSGASGSFKVLVKVVPSKKAAAHTKTAQPKKTPKKVAKKSVAVKPKPAIAATSSNAVTTAAKPKSPAKPKVKKVKTPKKNVKPKAKKPKAKK